MIKISQHVSSKYPPSPPGLYKMWLLSSPLLHRILLAGRPKPAACVVRRQLIKVSCMIDNCRTWEDNKLEINFLSCPDWWLAGCQCEQPCRTGDCNDNLMFRTKYSPVDLYVPQCLAWHRSRCYTGNTLTRSGHSRPVEKLRNQNRI